MSTGEARIEVEGVERGSKVSSTMVTRWSPSSFEAKIEIGDSVRILSASRGQVRIYDAGMGEWTQKEAPKGLPYAQLQKSVGVPPEPLRFLAEPAFRKSLLLSLTSSPSAKLVMVGSSRVIKASSTGKGASTAQMVFDAAGRLTELAFDVSSTRTKWRIRYGKEARIGTLSIPASAVKVAAFTNAATLPTFKSQEARSVALGMIRAANSLSSGILTLTTDEGQTRLQFARGRFREDSTASSWTFSNGQLSVKAGAFYRGTIDRSRVVEAVAECKAYLDPWARGFLLRRNPIVALISQPGTAEIGGEIVFGGDNCDILQFKGAYNRIAFFVSRKTHLPLSVEVVTVDDAGRSVARSSRTVRYSHMGQPFDGQAFALAVPTGVKVQPLPKLKDPTKGIIRG